MTTQPLKTYVVNLKRRPDRRARMERVLPASWDVQFTSDWDGPMDGQTLDPGNLPGFGLYRWEIPSDNPWWSRPLKLGEIGCAISHWLCWQRAAADGADPALILEDDAIPNELHAPLPGYLQNAQRKGMSNYFDVDHSGNEKAAASHLRGAPPIEAMPGARRTEIGVENERRFGIAEIDPDLASIGPAAGRQHAVHFLV